MPNTPAGHMHLSLTLERDLQHLNRQLSIDSQNPHLYVQRGMVHFKCCALEASIADFDSAERLHPALTPYLWQRGLAYYYVGRYTDGAQQFERDLAVNKQDVEETVWRFLCQAQVEGIRVAREALLPVHHDPRPVMACVYDLFAGTCDAETVLYQFHDREGHNAFYSHLYVGLYFEAHRDDAGARSHIGRAADMLFLDDYMGWLAMVHVRRRGWQRKGYR